jgi:hypothetical protein
MEWNVSRDDGTGRPDAETMTVLLYIPRASRSSLRRRPHQPVGADAAVSAKHGQVVGRDGEATQQELCLSISRFEPHHGPAWLPRWASSEQRIQERRRHPE